MLALGSHWNVMDRSKHLLLGFDLLDKAAIHRGQIFCPGAHIYLITKTDEDWRKWTPRWGVIASILINRSHALVWAGNFWQNYLYIHCESNCTVDEGSFHSNVSEGRECLYIDACRSCRSGGMKALFLRTVYKEAIKSIPSCTCSVKLVYIFLNFQILRRIPLCFM